MCGMLLCWILKDGFLWAFFYVCFVSLAKIVESFRKRNASICNTITASLLPPPPLLLLLVWCVNGLCTSM